MSLTPPTTCIGALTLIESPPQIQRGIVVAWGGNSGIVFSPESGESHIPPSSADTAKLLNGTFDVGVYLSYYCVYKDDEWIAIGIMVFGKEYDMRRFFGPNVPILLVPAIVVRMHTCTKEKKTIYLWNDQLGTMLCYDSDKDFQLSDRVTCLASYDGVKSTRFDHVYWNATHVELETSENKVDSVHLTFSKLLSSDDWELTKLPSDDQNGIMTNGVDILYIDVQSLGDRSVAEIEKISNVHGTTKFRATFIEQMGAGNYFNRALLVTELDETGEPTTEHPFLGDALSACRIDMFDISL